MFVTVRNKSKESGQRNQTANTNRSSYLSLKTGRCSNGNCTVEKGSTLSVNVADISAMVGR